MRYITIISGEYSVYIEQEVLQAIEKNPLIYRVPGADGNIAGISYYKNELVVYYQPLRPDGVRDIQWRCALIIRTDKGLVGIQAEVVGEEDTLPESAEQLTQGVWVINSD